MNRKHNIENYISIIEKLKKNKPSIKFSSDFIIGYPGETNIDYLETENLMKKIKFINSYSFLYSSRPGTPASKLRNVDINIAKQRLLDFQKISDEIKKNYRKSILGKSINVLFENKLKNQNRYFGRDEYSNSVIVENNSNLVGKIISVEINDFNHNTLFGKLKIKNKTLAA